MNKSYANCFRYFGRELRKAREKRGWSQEKLAGEAGMDRSYICKLENGNQLPGIERICIICGALDISPAKFFQNMLNWGRKKK